MQSHDTTSGAGKQAAPESIYIGIKEAAGLMKCSYAKARQAVSACNRRQKELGLFTIQGRALRSCFYEYVGITRQNSFFDAPKGAAR